LQNRRKHTEVFQIVQQLQYFVEVM